jgi:hypothetical protein
MFLTFTNLWQRNSRFLHVPMGKPMKFPLLQTTGQNFSMMPNIKQDLLALGQNQHSIC